MIPLTILCPPQTNPIFRQSLSREATLHGFQLNEFDHLGLDSHTMMTQLTELMQNTPKGIFMIVSNNRLELSSELHDLLLALSLTPYPNFSNAVTQNLSPKLTAFAQITAGRLNDAIVICIPQLLELIPNLLGILEAVPMSPPEKKGRSESPTVIGRFQSGEDPTPIQPSLQADIAPMPSASVSSAPQFPSEKSGWKAALAQLQLELKLDYAPLPEELSSIPAAYAVFEQAGEMKYAVDRHGNRFGVYGFPDLRRPHSKVLIVRPGAPYPEIIALHRFPAKVGILPTHHSGFLLSAGQGVEEACSQRTGRKNTGTAIIAVEPNVVYIQRNNDIVRWDGRRESDMGTIRQAIASLVLQWSQR